MSKTCQSEHALSTGTKREAPAVPWSADHSGSREVGSKEFDSLGDDLLGSYLRYPVEHGADKRPGRLRVDELADFWLLNLRDEERLGSTVGFARRYA